MSRATGFDMIGTILSTDDPHTLFGASKELGKNIYQRLVRNVHPDVTTDPRASEAFDRLQKLWDAMDAPTKAKTFTVSSKLHNYNIGQRIAKGTVSNVYRASWDAGHGQGVMKIARHPRDADMVAAEVKALKALREVPDRFAMYHLKLEDAFRFRDETTRTDRATVVTNYLDGFYSLQEVREAYPRGLDGRDVSWIFRRLLVAIGTANDLGLVHGAIVPEHVMIHPEMHGLVLVGWSHSVETGQPLKSAPPSAVAVMSADAKAKKPVDYKHDIRLAGATMQYLCNDTSPQLRAFFKGCSVSTVPEAAELLAEFDELLERLYGKRTFHPFTMPTRKDT